MAQDHSISICIITKNECANLKQCLKNLLPFVTAGKHEIVVVDTGSTDDTKEMCRAYTDRIFEFPWIDDFSAARNFAAAHATNDWILCIDSDEFITDWDEADLQHQLLMHPDSIGSFSLLCTCATGKNQYDSLSRVYRLYHRRFYHFEHPVHEQLIPLNARLCRSYFNVKIKARHLSYSGSAAELATKSERNIRLLKQELKSRPHDPYVLFQLGQSYYMMEDYDSAFHYYDLGLAEDVDPRLDYVNTMVVSYGYTLLNLKQYQKALDLEGIYDTFGNNADYVFLMGMIYLNNGFLDDAITQFTKATTFDTAEVIGANSFRAWHNLGVIYECAGYPRKAKDYYKKCGSFAPAKERLAALTL